jgi:hypothetical protein
LGGALTLLSATAALAVSVVLPPGGDVATPATTAATEPDLDGVVINDTLVPFSITTTSGGVVCAGQLQDRVVRSNKTGLLDFYYMIRDTKGTGAVGRIATRSFAGQTIRVAYRTDGLGTVPPGKATRAATPGAIVTFTFDQPVNCAKAEWSRFILIATQVKAFQQGGETELTSNTVGSTVVKTVQP